MLRAVMNQDFVVLFLLVFGIPYLLLPFVVFHRLKQILHELRRK